MPVSSSFDQWQKDVFFSAAEEVQQSTDKLESWYRTWIRNRRDGSISENSDGVLRDLQTALGTAKWQLEEFERAVGLSYNNCSSEDNAAIVRHSNFIAAIRSQILQMENEINCSLREEGKKPICWVQLDEDERDDLASFLSGDQATDFKPQSKVVSEPACTIDIEEEKRSPEVTEYIRNGYGYRELLRPQRRLSKYLRFEPARKLGKNINQLITRRWYHLTSCKEDSIPRTRQPAGRARGFQNYLQVPQPSPPFGRSIRLTLVLVLTVVFVAPFVIYSA